MKALENTCLNHQEKKEKKNMLSFFKVIFKQAVLFLIKDMELNSINISIIIIQ